jgi:peptidyl-prolyl cis-trans isomerase SurA
LDVWCAPRSGAGTNKPLTVAAAGGRRGEKANGARMLDGLITCRRLVAMLVVALPMLSATAYAQQVVVIVNGDPITALDIEQRSKLTQLSTHKTPSRQEVLEELINEKLKVKEAKRWGLEVTDAEVDQSYAQMAGRMRITADQLTQQLARAGIYPTTLKSRIRADMAWPQLVRGRYSGSLQIGEKDILTATESKSDDVGYDYTLRPILFVVPPGSPEGFIDGRKREAEALRGRFTSCDDGIAFARALKEVTVREQIVRTTADIPPDLRKVLDDTGIGHLTAPELTKVGVEMFAVCAKKETAVENRPGQRKAREAIMTERYEKKSKEYLDSVRRGAMIEYRATQ